MTATTRVVVDLARPDANGCLPVSATGTLTGANGDTLVLRQSGSACPIGSKIFKDVLTYDIVRGTGRFAGATGSGTVVIVARPDGGTAMLEGAVSSPGSFH